MKTLAAQNQSQPTWEGREDLAGGAPGAILDEAIREICDLAELYRIDACRRVDQATRGKLGQFLTPPAVAERLAGLFGDHDHEDVVLLDPGAGVGGLTAAAVRRLLALSKRPRSLLLIAWEVEPVFLPLLRDVLAKLCRLCTDVGIKADFEIRNGDFISGAISATAEDLFRHRTSECTHAILNPPFRKIRSDSEDRRSLSGVGIECTNLYTAFVWLAGRLLCSGGELAAITPRSFCNGPYFRPFREWVISKMALDHVVMIEERDLAFSDDEVLQETVLYHGVRGDYPPAKVLIETASGCDLLDSIGREMVFSEFVLPGDPEKFFHLIPDSHQGAIKHEMEALPCSLRDLGIDASTGRVVDFRATEYLRSSPEGETIPLIYPQHLVDGTVRWPVVGGKKCNALLHRPETESLCVPMGHYVLLRRFTAKEEKRRVVATVFEPTAAFAGARWVGFENHLNYYHENGRPLDPELARGLAAFLNSSAVDEYFRQFNGHTQVNATDLRRIRYPSKEQLISLGVRCSEFQDQNVLDGEIARVLNFMPSSTTALEAQKRIDEALTILKAFDVPHEQQNERSALVLLTLAGIKATIPWGSASRPMLGITEIMDSIRDDFGKTYAPNTRETIRRFTVHQFVQIGLLQQNPDKPTRAINSPHNVYQLQEEVLVLLRSFGSPDWAEALRTYKQTALKLCALRDAERTMHLIPVKMPGGDTVELSAGGQNELMKAIVEQFCARFTPGGTVLYLGDAGKKFIVERLEELANLGVAVDEHGKMPDVVVHFGSRNWLVLIEAVTSHGPMNLKRKNELQSLFSGSKAGLVFVTAFATRSDMMRFLPEISWETEVWVADSPSHMIHFNGERFLGPYEEGKRP